MNEETVTVVGIRYKPAGRVYYFDPAGIDIQVNDYVVVNTPRGLKLGYAVIAPTQIPATEITDTLKPVVRLATPDDIQVTEELAAKEPQVLAEAAEEVAKLSLPMKLISVEHNLEGNHLTIYFKAAERVDFRELVKALNSHFKMRVELRQVGPRDEAKLVGGYGRCGRPLCCATFLDEFSPVSIKMAKQQGLPLNPMKIAGSCGRLLCCLSYEIEQTDTKAGKARKTSGNGDNGEPPDELPVDETPEESETAKAKATAENNTVEN